MAEQTQTQSGKAAAYTYGIEIECLLPSSEIRRLGIQIGHYHHGIQLPAPFPEGWTCESDSSVSTNLNGYRGVEIVSPVLRGADGIAQVKRVAEILQDLHARVNPTCGQHIHVGVESVLGWAHTTGERAEWVAKLLYQVAMHETALYASTGTHRREEGTYARPISGSGWNKVSAEKIRKASARTKAEALRDAVSMTSRYQTLNLQNLHGRGTVEFRYGAGSTEATKMLLLIQTCLALAERATETTRMDWAAAASGTTYKAAGAGSREVSRLLYLLGWTKGRRQVGSPTCEMAGWIAPLEDLAPVRNEIRRLAAKYDAAG